MWKEESAVKAVVKTIYCVVDVLFGIDMHIHTYTHTVDIGGHDSIVDKMVLLNRIKCFIFV